jgi:hypothetical protein
MVRIRQNDAGSDFLHLLGRKALDGRLRSDRHEHRQLDIPVRSVQNAVSRPAVPVLMKDLNSEMFAHGLFFLL